MAGLDRLNALSKDDAESDLRLCGGASRWAREMVARRPFRDAEQLMAVAEEVWQRLEAEDWLEAVSRHPRIGQKAESAPKSGAAGAGRHWSSQEQSGAHSAASDVIARLAEGNRKYQERFGYIFIVCATGKSAEQMLAILDARLHNEPASELLISAEELRQIMLLRVRKLLAAHG